MEEKKCSPFSLDAGGDNSLGVKKVNNDDDLFNMKPRKEKTFAFTADQVARKSEGDAAPFM